MEPTKSSEGAGYDHSVHVEAWFDRAARGLPADQLLARFELAFQAVWMRAHVTLGDVTLTAIADRVLHIASAEFPVLASLRLEHGGLDCRTLKERADLRADHLEAGIQFVLTEFLSVMGALTAEVLSPALHKELAGVSQDACKTGADSSPNSEPRSGQGAKEIPE